MREVAAHCLVIALGVILAVNFVLFWLYGGLFIYESNRAILLMETALSVAIIGLGTERLVDYVRKQRGSG